jgi:hypothetical protein
MRAEVHTALALAADIGLWRYVQRLHRAHEIARRLFEPKDDGHAVICFTDQLQRVAQRPV